MPAMQQLVAHCSSERSTPEIPAGSLASFRRGCMLVHSGLHALPHPLSCTSAYRWPHTAAPSARPVCRLHGQSLISKTTSPATSCSQGAGFRRMHSACKAQAAAQPVEPGNSSAPAQEGALIKRRSGRPQTKGTPEQTSHPAAALYGTQVLAAAHSLPPHTQLNMNYRAIQHERCVAVLRLLPQYTRPHQLPCAAQVQHQIPCPSRAALAP